MANEIQKITPSTVPTGGSWKIVYDGAASVAIASGSNAATVQAAAEGIAAIGSGNVSVTGDESSGFTFEFIGSLANTNMLTLSYQDNTLTIAGSATFATTQDGGGGQNEVQTIVIDADGGTFTINLPSYGTTGTLNWNDGIEPIASAIQALIGGSSVNGSGSFPSYTFEFFGPVTNTDIGQMEFGTNGLTIAVSISVSVLQEGSPAPASSNQGALLTMGVG